MEGKLAMLPANVDCSGGSASGENALHCPHDGCGAILSPMQHILHRVCHVYRACHVCNPHVHVEARRTSCADRVSP